MKLTVVPLNYCPTAIVFLTDTEAYALCREVMNLLNLKQRAMLLNTIPESYPRGFDVVHNNLTASELTTDQAQSNFVQQVYRDPATFYHTMPVGALDTPDKVDD